MLLSENASDSASNNLDPNCSNYPADFVAFKATYGVFHMYFCLILCPVGVVTNIVNVIVLNQKKMRSPTNLLLTGLAVSDGLIMAFYIPFNGYFLLGDHLLHSPYPWVMYLFFYLVAQNCLHAFSSCLIVALSIFRLIYTRSLNCSQQWCNVTRVKIAVAVSLLISMLVSVPYLMCHRIIKAEGFSNVQSSRNDSWSRSNDNILYRMDIVHDTTSRALLFWTHGIVLKFLPILLLSVLSACIIHALRRVDQKKRTLLAKQKDKLSKQSRNTSRTTKMLLTIVLIFICAYLPQAIFIVLNASLGLCFLQKVYDNIGDVMDLLTLVNNGVNFVLYCTMSKRFRETFINLFCCGKHGHTADGTEMCTTARRTSGVFSMGNCRTARN